MPLRRGGIEKGEAEDGMENGRHERAKCGNGWARRWARSIATAALALFAPHLLAAPPAGTAISNQASASAQVGAVTQSANSNTVLLTVGAAAPGTYLASITPNHVVTSAPGATLYFTHVLTNNGANPDTYTLSTTNMSGGFAFASVALYPDANGDGVPDGAVPIGAPVTLNPGQAYRFVAKVVVPASVGSFAMGRLLARAASGGGAVIAPAEDTVQMPSLAPGYCARVVKSMSPGRSASPGPITITLDYLTCDKAQAKFVISDTLPRGLRYVPGSGRWSVTGGLVLTDAVADDRQGSGDSTIAYDYDVSARGSVTATVFNLPAGTVGHIQFQATIDPDVDVGMTLPNVAAYTVYDSGGQYERQSLTNLADVIVTGRVDLDLTGQRLATAVPGETASFSNVLTNRGTATETFDISVGDSTFPAGTTFALFKADGVTPLADTDGNGTPDTGPVAAGAKYTIVLKASIPATAPPASYKVTKIARAASAPMRSASADDVVDTLSLRCAAQLDDQNQARVGFGEHVTYAHYLANRGNCTETVTAALDYLSDSRAAAGWTSAAYVDGKTAGRGSLPGVVDPQDTRIDRSWTATIGPGETIRLLVDVLAPSTEAANGAKAAKAAKSLVDSNVTTLSITSSGSGTLLAKDTTTLDDGNIAVQPSDAIRNFTDASYLTPTAWAVVGGNAWLRADAASCNASPDTIDRRTVVITGPGGEREEATAVETGPDTGIFLVPALPVRAPPVTAGDGVLEGDPDATFEVEMEGCARPIRNVVTLMAPRSVVFDSASGEPIGGATVTLVGASGSTCSATPAAGVAGNPATSGSDGAFTFPPVAAGSYCLVVQPPNGHRFPSRVPWTRLPAGHNLVVTGSTSGASYGNPFTVGASGLVVVDLPVDGAPQDGLFVQKDASRAQAEVGDFVDYTVRVRNGTGNALDRADVVLGDDLPAGFAYMPGTARRDGAPIAEPQGGLGPHLAFTLGHLGRDQQVTLTYRLRLGPGSLQGDGVNRAQASYRADGATTLSNVASTKVQVTGGVFSEKGFILGKVFLDCDANGMQDRGEAGVPGVRVLIEDGTYAITDDAGKYSFYGLDNRTHVVKVDRTTLPPGARLEALSSRNLGDGASRIADLKAGELLQADFAIEGCAPALLSEVKSRASKASGPATLATLAGARLATVPLQLTDVKALPASGEVSLATPGAVAPVPGITPIVGAPSAIGTGFSQLAPMPAAPPPSPAPHLENAVKPAAEPVAPPPLEALLPKLDRELAFVGLADGDTLAFAQATVRVKGTAGSTFRLTVNGVEVDAKHVGKRATLAQKQVQAWEYIGVPLAAGKNVLEASQVDGFGNPRGSVKITVVAPGELARIAIELPSKSAVADGKTAARVVVKLADEHGVPVAARTPVTLETSSGTWQVKDLDPTRAGVQVFVEGGRAEFGLVPPGEPGEARINAQSGDFKAEARLDFLPNLREMVASGVLEGIVNMRNIGTRALQPTRVSDGFEQELRQLSREWDNGRTQAGARAAFYLKGKIKGEYLLTAAYDSDKDTQERLFRDIQPDEFYPIYGDSSQRGYDAQSTSKLYVRVDHQRSYLLWGDFTTASTAEVRKLGNYSRSLTGVREHFETSRASVNAFASRDTTRQVIEEFPANGTSGPFQLGTSGALVNSEKVEIITRDRNQPAIVISTAGATRFVDYEIETLTGRILFKAPVPSRDRDLNPVFIRVTYEVDQGGAEFWVAGVDGEVKLTDRVQAGGIYVRDQNPLQPFTLEGADVTVKVGEGTYAMAEAAHTENGLDEHKGNGGRVEIRHDSANLKAQAYYARTDKDFDNPGAYINQGRGEAGGRLEYRLSPKTTIKAQALRTEDASTGSVIDGAEVTLRHQLKESLTLEVGVRHAAQKGLAAAVPVVDGSTPPTQPLPDDVNSVRARLTGAVPGVKGASVYAEGEVDVTDAQRKVIAAGGEYQLNEKSRVYARHEFISSINGPYELNQNERQNTTAVGIETEYMKDARLFSEYRIRDAMSGGDAEAAIGLRNLWSLRPGLNLGTTFERVHAFSGTGQDENTAATFALEYTASENWKGSTRLEVRRGDAQESLLFTAGLAARMNRDWTALARNSYDLTRNRTDGSEHVIERVQAGIAWRDHDTNRWNALARVEHRLESDDTTQGVQLRTATQLFSLNADWHPIRPFTVSARYAAKWESDRSNGLATRYRAQVVGARATWDFAPRWDVGFVTSALMGGDVSSRQYGIGLEVGYLVATNLWVSAGYNLSGYRDADLSGADYTARGPYVRMRYKFDETTLEEVPGAKKVMQSGEGAR
jgi:uncharacterized repeat protein (TIGR01451 family)